ncbi:VOC family protein [Streptomyces canus]|uniref:Enzyme related to lactoylglutathione lyase n=1 Tax=Streptomyces canus TaxID=58343 RepID=A0AAW8FHT5_9ACTN|nr:VOC family protein [Streptomyces canus]MDQ0762941.1 putative enzyme related to lactoylglutathione lyase [Streptomyces canus]MDQ0908602.1 putative enzyme related to lactoylglutathione lyase [Streptomyces canus]MDQ1068602.1 putative enzyme related to lactoylglutathione lyase [Streptomyces canus]
MIQGLGIATVWTFDQQRTKAFFTEKLDFEVRSEVSMGEMTWVTVSAKEQQGVELALMSLDGPGLDPESAEALKKLVGKGVMGAGAFRTDDCRGDYETFRARGVEFVQEPQERPYGIEAIFRDDSGNWYSLTQRSEELDFSKDWA